MIFQWTLALALITTTLNPPVVQDNERTVNFIRIPGGYKLIELEQSDFGTFLRNIALKDDKTVYLYDGRKKYSQDVQYEVLDISVGDKDLQQCADAVMRLRAEYLWSSGRKDEISFHFTSGDEASWTKYSEGYRPKISGSNVTWIKSASPDSSRRTFDRYLMLIFSYCGTYSLHGEMNTVANPKDVMPGDVFIQTGNPYGHAVIVMNVAVNEAGEKIFLLAQSYMPAQDIHILVNPNNNNLSPWYTAKDSGILRTPEWTFNYSDLKRF